ncbi:Acyl-CoA N-acyltransferase [Niveomyces insectorum RCEF 264]|uniref:Acyl-CoA N-acyltransferase n=1 Tax=Niveomyces insectorum RCEF 264 TaxID=1081102 RepID=A0A162MRP2_9HYPO|nr:Acyl-CoA N-acyltransferase [Niveomyces insectorum RCEF 264]
MANSASVFHYDQPRLDNDVVALEPFDPSVHLSQSVKRFREHPEILAYMAFPPLDDEDVFVRTAWEHIRSSPADCLFAVRDKAAVLPGAQEDAPVAGFVTLSSTNPMNATTELGIVLFPEFHHTHVATNAVGLILEWLLDPPSAGGLGLRRVEWKTHADNASARQFAAHIGFELEGICRWERVVQPGKPGAPVVALQTRNGTDMELLGLHTAVYSIVWDEWDVKRPNVVAQMERKR